VEYLNDPRFLADPHALGTIPGQALTDATVAFVAQVRADAPAMLATPAFAKLMLPVTTDAGSL